ncbi:hypothetical protein MGH68_04670 [Erysipelothrix sp. D19-032]
MSENNYLKQMLQKHGVLIASHRGLNGGYIAQNTILAYKNALRHGAHILEIDVIEVQMAFSMHFTTVLRKQYLDLIKIFVRQHLRKSKPCTLADRMPRQHITNSNVWMMSLRL